MICSVCVSERDLTGMMGTCSHRPHCNMYSVDDGEPPHRCAVCSMPQIHRHNQHNMIMHSTTRWKCINTSISLYRLNWISRCYIRIDFSLKNYQPHRAFICGSSVYVIDDTLILYSLIGIHVFEDGKRKSMHNCFSMLVLID